MTTTLIGAGAALLGIVVGQLFSRNTEYKKWLRSEWHKACSELLNVTQAAHVRYVSEHQLVEMLTANIDKLDIQHPEEMTRIKSAAEEAFGQPLSDEVFEEVVQHLENPNYDFRARRLARELEQHDLNTQAWFLRNQGLVEQLGVAMAKVRLICPTSVVIAADQLMTDTLEASSATKNGLEAWTTADTAFIEARRRFVRTTRGVLVPKRRIAWPIGPKRAD